LYMRKNPIKLRRPHSIKACRLHRVETSCSEQRSGSADSHRSQCHSRS
jgi:hypothetical protein